METGMNGSAGKNASMSKALLACILAFLLAWATPGLGLELTATGHDSRIDLVWTSGDTGYHVYRSDEAEGPFEKLTNKPWKLTVYSDFLGENGRTCHYRITSADRQGAESASSETVSARSYAMTDEELLTSV
jgi:hypothetical protein